MNTATLENQPKNIAFDKIANQMLDLMKKSNLPIWRAGYLTLRQRNYKSNRPYNGLNLVILSLFSKYYNYTSEYWITFNQIVSEGGKLKKGSKGVQILYYFPINDKEIKEREEKRISDPSLKKVEPIVRPRTYTVFNLDCVENINIIEREEQEKNTVEQIEKLILNHKSLPEIKHFLNAQPLYDITHDKIEMPLINQFINKDEYYSTLFHELGHSTGAKNRLNRESLITSNMTKETYSFEELIAEFTACFCVNQFNLKPDLEYSAAYLNGWFKYISEYPNNLVRAIQNASKATNYILGE